MRLTRRSRTPQTGRMLLTAGALLIGSLHPTVLGQEDNATTLSNPKSGAAQVQAAANREAAAANFSPGIQEILKLAEAGISREVIKAFIEKSATAYDPTAEELIALKQRGVPDEVITALLERGAKLRAPANQASGTVAMPAIVRQFSTGGTLDPESYDFWYSHYAYPRALSYSYRTLAPYAPDYRYSVIQTFPSYWQFSPGRGHWGSTGVRNGFHPTIRNRAFHHRFTPPGRTFVVRSR